MTAPNSVDISDADPDVVGGRTAAACLFHGFSDPNRITILQHLALGEHRVVDLTAHLGLAQSTVSKHLACLRGCGLITSRAEGRATVYSLNHASELMDLWAAAERLLALTGDRVTLCDADGTEAVGTEAVGTEAVGTGTAAR
ncbi:MAG: ArsR/SmtB family transcription factor [Dermatophilaceae bacterium]